MGKYLGREALKKIGKKIILQLGETGTTACLEGHRSLHMRKPEMGGCQSHSLLDYAER